MLIFSCRPSSGNSGLPYCFSSSTAISTIGLIRAASRLVLSSAIIKRELNFSCALSRASVSLPPQRTSTTASSTQIPRQGAGPIGVRMPYRYCITHTSGAFDQRLMLLADRWSMPCLVKPSVALFMGHDLPDDVAQRFNIYFD